MQQQPQTVWTSQYDDDPWHVLPTQHALQQAMLSQPASVSSGEASQRHTPIDHSGNISTHANGHSNGDNHMQKQSSDQALSDQNHDESAESGILLPCPRSTEDSPVVGTADLHPHASGSGPSLKRGMACGFCRRRKLRCSGTRPLCSNCQKYNKQCEYGPASKVAKVRDLEHKIAELSEYIQSSGIPGVDRIPPAFSSTPLPHHPNPSFLPPQPQSYEAQSISSNGSANIYAPSLTPRQAEPHPVFAGYSRLSGFESPYTYGFGSIGSLEPHPMDTEAYMPQVQTEPLTEFGGYNNNQFVDPIAVIPPVPPPQLSNMSTVNAQHISSRSPFAFAPEAANSYSPVYDDRPEYQQLASTSMIRSRETSHKSSPDDSIPLPLPAQPTTHAPADGRDMSLLYPTSEAGPSKESGVDGLTERLGEFLFSSKEGKDETPKVWAKKPRATKSVRGTSGKNAGTIMALRAESDGLDNATRQKLIDTFLSIHKLFFDMSVPRFRYRMTFNDRRRPSLAFLHAIYLWGTRVLNPSSSSAEDRHFAAACQAFETSAASGDRLLDAIRAAMLLSSHAYTQGRHHQGWLLAGHAVTLCRSMGLHQIRSCVFRPEPPRNPFLRVKHFMLPPPEDALELGERIHVFWSVFTIDRCGALATGFPSALKDEDITTPLCRPLEDIESGAVSHNDDYTVRDLYRVTYDTSQAKNKDYLRFLKCVAILERASKLAFVDVEDGSEYARQWASYHLIAQSDPSTPQPPPWLEQPRYRCPTAYAETKLGLELVISTWGEDAIFPPDRKRKAEMMGMPVPDIPPKVIVLHHLLATTHMLLHDVDSLEAENKEALVGARKNVALLRHMPPIPKSETDHVLLLIWTMAAKTLIKEMHRLRVAGDHAAAVVPDEESNVIIAELHRVGYNVSETHALSMEELKRQSITQSSGGLSMPTVPMPSNTTYYSSPY
ncbi:hypothetical protein M231_01761 [Tremella mesenterica]|uniref:Zn(2)-C6 fungal-type domain-containing protein n=1 Tax=Tremella mesenterica TaxID=5217 RepID=A0A4Q1BSB0_TREME|nr:hypothetical protein M231_01761 [Tremella mesenterica]